MAGKIYRSPFPDLDLVETDLITYLFSNPQGAPASRLAFVDAESKRALTYGEVIDQTRVLAHGLNQAGVQPGDVVAVFSPNTLEYPLCCYSILWCGATVSTVNPALTSSEVCSQLKTARAKVVFTHSSLAETARKAVEGSTHVRTIIQTDGRSLHPDCDLLLSNLLQQNRPTESQARHPAPLNQDHPAFICFSSGTSGAAKGVVLTHRNITANIQQWNHLYHSETTPGRVTVNFLPFSHIYGLNVFICGGFHRGQTNVLLSKFSLDVYLRTIQEYRPEELYLVPPVAIRLVKDSTLSEYNLRCVRRILSAAAPLTAEMAANIEAGFKAAYGTQVHCHQSWGLTETSPLATGVPPSCDDPRQRHTVGVIVPNMEFRLVHPETMQDVTDTDEDGATVPGEILCRGPNVTPGYLDNAEATRTSSHTDEHGVPWFKTGDIASIDKAGFVTIKDRIKEMIKYKGLQVVPSELEGTLQEHPDVDDCGVTSRFDARLATELPVAFVVLKPHAARLRGAPREAVARDIHRWLNGQVANHKRLRGGIRFVDQIPKTPSGKILRRLLRDQVHDVGAANRNRSAKL